MGNELRQNLTGAIYVNNNAHCLNQYADDTGILSTFEQKAFDTIISELDRFERNSGMKVSYEKTTVYRMGSLRNSNAVLYTAKPLAWSNIGVDVLGVRITDDNIVSTNFQPVIAKAKVILNKWQKRGLSLLGKVQVINSLVASLFVHKMTVLPNMKTSDIKGMEAHMSNFIWNGKKAKISLVKTSEV